MRKPILLLVLAATCISGLYAQRNITDSLLSLLKSMPEDTNKVNLLRETGISVIFQEPLKAIPYFKQAIHLSKKLNFNPGLERNYAATSTAFAFNAQYDSTLAYIDTAIHYGLKVGDVNRLALIYLNRADAYENLHRLNEALRDCDTAMGYAEKSGNKDRLARIYNIFSDIYEQQDRLEPSMEYIVKASALYREIENFQMVGQSYFDMAMLYKKKKQIPTAIQYYKKAIALADSVGDIKNLSSYYGDYAAVLVDEKRFSEGEAMATKALQYARQVKNDRQEAVIHTLFHHLYLAQDKLDKAIAAALASYNILKQHGDLEREQAVASMLSDDYYKQGNIAEAYKYLKVSHQLNDSLFRQTFSAETAKLQTAFDVAQKEKEILLLNKDNELQQQKLSRQRLLTAGSVVLVLLSLLGVALLVSRYRMRQRMKEMQIRNQIAADLHDEVGSSLSSIHMLSEMATTQEGGRQEILMKVSNYTRETMDKMGDIVWMIKPSEQESKSLKERMERFLYEMCSSRNMPCSFEWDGPDTTKLTMEQRKSLYLIFKEAVNNAVKYSGGDHLAVRLGSDGRKLQLSVHDNGRGFDPQTIKKGNGLDNMMNRAKTLGGNIHLTSKEGEGTMVRFSLPV